jgi:methionyl-tRNA formyltransferase
MKLVFMGTPEFALPSLEKLFNSRHKIAAVVTAPDKERGRGQKVSFTPVKEFALEKNIPLLQPEKLKDENFLEKLKEINADLFIVVAFRILPEDVFALPPKGSFNLHASLLPKYRGAAPIQWALINGEKETGVTTFALEKKVDTGNIFLQEKTEILSEDNFGSLHDRLSIIGSDVVLKTVDLIDSGDYSLKPQSRGRGNTGA